MKHKLWHRVLAAVMAGIICCSLLPVAALAQAEQSEGNGTSITEKAQETPGDTEATTLPDTTAPPQAENNTTATPESAVQSAAEAFIAAVNDLDRDTILSSVNAWGLAHLAWEADPENAELLETLNTAAVEADRATNQVYVAQELYSAIAAEEQNSEPVATAYSTLCALFSAMTLAMQYPNASGADTEPDLTEITEMLYGDLPDAPTGSYIGEMGLPVATGDTKISIGPWTQDLFMESTARLDAEALNREENTLAVGFAAGQDYAVIPILMQVEYPANGSTATISLPEDVTLLGYSSVAEKPVAATKAETEKMLHYSYTDTSAAAAGIYVQADHDFTAVLTYEDPDGNTLEKELTVEVQREAEAVPVLLSAGISTYADPTPPYTSGKITSISFVGGTWLIWFNGQEAYCCDHGKDGQPTNCPPYTYANTSKLEPGQYTPGDHYGNQVNIWGGLDQLSLDNLTAQHEDISAANAFAARGIATYAMTDAAPLQFAYQYYDDTQLFIIEHYPQSVAAQIYLNAASAAVQKLSGIETYASGTGYYTFIYTCSNSAWQTVALIGPPITEETEPTPTPTPGDTPTPTPTPTYDASWSVNVEEQASASFHVSMTVSVDKTANITHERLNDAEITVSGNPAGGSLDGGSWEIVPSNQIIRTVNGDGTVTFSYQGSVTKSASRSDSGSVDGMSSQEAADSAAESEKAQAESSLRAEAAADAQNQANAAAQAAAAVAREFLLQETCIPHGFDATDSSTQTQTVQPNGSVTAVIHNQPWQASVLWEKLDAVSGGRLTEDTEFVFYEWSTATNDYQISPNYRVVRKADGRYTIRCMNPNYTDWAEGFVYYTQTNLGRFKIVEKTAAYGYTQSTQNGNSPWVAEFTITQQNQVVEYLGENADRNKPWGNKIIIRKTDSETGSLIASDAAFSLYEWNQARGLYEISTNYAVVRDADGSYTVQCLHDWPLAEYGSLYFEDTLCDTRENTANHDGTTSTHTQFYNDYAMRNYPNDRSFTNDGQFIIVEHTAPYGYYGDWTDTNRPGSSGSDLGKRAYYLRLTGDGSTLVLGNADYNADIATANKGGVQIETASGVVTVAIYSTARNADRSYNTDNSDTAANENSYAMTANGDTFQNDRVLGEISLSKVDLDAVRYVAGRDNQGNALESGQAHGEAVLDGAVYDLYAAEDITHPDGVTGVVDYSKITDASGKPIWHTTIRDNAGFWVTDYLPVLAKDHLVASAEIKNGWLTFSNLYLGRYYIVERSTGVLIPVEDGAFKITGSYPTINAKTKEQNGGTAALATNAAGQYTDWVYKNQFTSIGQSKALDGTKTYDGYYISCAKGYLADEHNYYITPTYHGEGWYVEKTTFSDNRQADGEERDKASYNANYHIHKDNELAESDDQVMKGNVELSKHVSSTGSSDGIDLEGAGFTFYLVSELSKADQFATSRSGVYQLNSILKAYIKADYDDSTLKYDFTGEAQAIAKTYEVDAAEIAAYNQSLTEAGDYRNGKGKGWVATGRANEYQLAEIFSNDTGNIRVQGLPYGQYLVVETTTPKDVFQAQPFLVTVDPADSFNPQSGMADPKDAAIPGSDSYQKYTVLDEEVEVYLRVTKIDEETGKAVQLPNTAFQIYWLDENGNYQLDANGNPKLVVMTNTEDGTVGKNVDTFYTNENGVLTLPEKLPLGSYRLVEVQGPNGFYNEWAATAVYDGNNLHVDDSGVAGNGSFYVDFSVTTDRIYHATGNDDEDSQGTLVIDEQYINNETIGKLTLRKLGEVLSDFVYEEGNDKIDPAYTGEAAPGHFTYVTRPVAGAEFTITAAEDIYTQDRQTDANGNRTLWYAKGDVVAVVTTGDGTADTTAFAPARTDATYSFLSVIHDGTVGEVSVTLPLGSYHIEETKPPYGYVGTAQSYDVTFAWDNQTNDVVLAQTIVSHDEHGKTATAEFEIVTVKEVTDRQAEEQILVFRNEREKGKIGAYKRDSKTKELLAGAVFNLYTDDAIYNADGKRLFAAGDLIATSPATDANGYTWFDIDPAIRGKFYGVTGVYLPNGKDASTNSGNYTIVEIRPPDGYYLNDAPMHCSFTYDGQAVQLLENDCLNDATSALISKRELTGDDELPGATLTIQDASGNTVRQWVSSDKPTEIRGLHLYEVYTLVETRPADGYALAASIQFTLSQKEDKDGNLLNENEVYVLTGKDWLIFDHWELMKDGMVVMRDDITRVKISKQDITNHKELPGAHLTLTDENGHTVEEWTSGCTPHYIEKLPAGDYTLHEITAPDGYKVAESIQFTVEPTGEIQPVTMHDTPDKERGILITKVDADTGKVLEGAEFQILDRTTKKVVQWQGEDGVWRDCYNITNEAGNIWFTLPNGDYYFQEVHAPKGYEVNSALFAFTISDEQTEHRFIFRNTKKTPLIPMLPQTGDNTPLGMLLAMALFSLCGFGILAACAWRKRHGGNLPAVLQDDPDDDPENEKLDYDRME